MIDHPTNEILIIGELNIDLIASGLTTQPVLGKEILAGEFEVSLGSASAIFACGAARLGRGITFVGMVGNDEFGKFCIASLSACGISTDRIIFSENFKTGVTMVMSTARDRAMVTYLGAISELSFEQIPQDVFDGHRHMHLTSFYLQTGLQRDFPRLMRMAKKKGLTTSFDPNSDPEGGGIEKISGVLQGTDILFVNEGEAKQLTRQSDVRSAGAALSSYCPMVVVKLGADGSVAFRNDALIEAPGFKVDVVDTTGAGDSFAAGFLHAYLHDPADIHRCLVVGNACGALSTRKPGGTTAQPDLVELEHFLAAASLRAGN